MEINIASKKFWFEILKVIGNLNSQGLIFYENILYESSGNYGLSKFIKYKRTAEDKEFENLELSKVYNLPSLHFAEDIDYLIEGTKIFFYQITWKENVIYKYNKNIELEAVKKMPLEIKEGWGLTHNPEDPLFHFLTDGTNIIYKVDLISEDTKIIKKHKIFYSDGKPANFLNALQWKNGKIWANIYLTTKIVEISLIKNTVDKIFDFKEILSHANSLKIELDNRSLAFDECLNGIAYDSETKRLFITGKNWNSIYEITLDN